MLNPHELKNKEIERLCAVVETARPLYEELKKLGPAGSGWNSARTPNEDKFVEAFGVLDCEEEVDEAGLADMEAPCQFSRDYRTIRVNGKYIQRLAARNLDAIVSMLDPEIVRISVARAIVLAIGPTTLGPELITRLDAKGFNCKLMSRLSDTGDKVDELIKAGLLSG